MEIQNQNANAEMKRSKEIKSDGEGENFAWLRGKTEKKLNSEYGLFSAHIKHLVVKVFFGSKFTEIT